MGKGSLTHCPRRPDTQGERWVRGLGLQLAFFPYKIQEVPGLPKPQSIR